MLTADLLYISYCRIYSEVLLTDDIYPPYLPNNLTTKAVSHI